MKISRIKFRRLIQESIEPELQAMIDSKDIDVVRQAITLLSGAVEYAHASGDRQYVQSAVLPILRKYESVKLRFKKNKNSWSGYFPSSVEEWDSAQRNFNSGLDNNFPAQNPGEIAPYLPPRYYVEDLELLGIYEEFLKDTMKFLTGGNLK